jgi:hypothetical protein
MPFEEVGRCIIRLTKQKKQKLVVSQLCEARNASLNTLTYIVGAGVGRLVRQRLVGGLLIKRARSSNNKRVILLAKHVFDPKQRSLNFFTYGVGSGVGLDVGDGVGGSVGLLVSMGGSVGLLFGILIMKQTRSGNSNNKRVSLLAKHVFDRKQRSPISSLTGLGAAWA